MLLLLALLFVASRLAFYAAGVQFDLRPLDTSWQLLDPELLKHDLLRSAFYMSGQPPLYNLLIGGLLQMSPTDQAAALIFRVFYAGLGLGITFLLYALLRRFDVPRALAATGALLFAVSPAAILYENIPYYTLMVVALLTLSAVLTHRLLTHFTFRRALALFFALATLIYVRSMFQLYWLLVLIGFLLLVLPEHRRSLLKAAAVPVLLVLALYCKNQLVTGHFGSSHWLGLSAIKLSCLPLPIEERERLVVQGTLSPLALKAAYETPERLPEYFSTTQSTGIRVLDGPRKSTDHVNYNHLAYVAVARDSLRDAVHALREHPAVYLRSIATSFLMFWRPASDYPFLKENREAIDRYSRLYALSIAGQPVYPEDPWFDYEAGTLGYLLMAAYLLSAGFGLYVVLSCLRAKRATAAEATLIFMWLNVMYVSVIGNAFEIGENQRFRFQLHPLLITMLMALALQLMRLWQARGVRAGAVTELNPSATER